MLQKLLKLNNVGLFRAACSPAPTLSRATVIYADNGMGKSTLSAVLRAAGNRDANAVRARRTVDCGPGEIATVEILLSDNALVEFGGAGWVGPQPKIDVFDAEFVESNVCLGLRVDPEQREQLLGFALGPDASKVKRNIEEMGAKVKEALDARKAAEVVLHANREPYTVEEYVKLTPRSDVDALIAETEARLGAAKRAATILARPYPECISKLGDLSDKWTSLLARTVGDIHEEACARVEEHLRRFDASTIEEWVSGGVRYLPSATCPFCGQDTSGLQLVEAYPLYFAEAYRDVQREADEARDDAEKMLDKTATSVQNVMERNAERLQAWSDMVAVSFPSVDMAEITDALTTLGAVVLQALEAKRARPARVPDIAAFRAAVAQAGSRFDAAVSAYNTSVEQARDQLTSIRSSLETDNRDVLERDLRRLRAEKRRGEPDVSKAAEDYKDADRAYRTLTEDKAKLTDELDTLSGQQLSAYGVRVNQILSQIGAAFKIVDPKRTSVGGQPRIEYELGIRERKVNLKPSVDQPSFRTALSEGDKRALAFAFFVARLDGCDDVNERTIVLDDPMCSMDRHRRTATLALITSLVATAGQVILLTHDPFVARDFVEQLGAPPLKTRATCLKITPGQGGYSVFADFDPAQECESRYSQRYRLVESYVNGEHGNADRVAESLRPLLEGYYQRRFPSRIGRHTSLGKIIEAVRDAKQGNPLVHLQPLVDEMSTINDYATRFHHADAEVPSGAAVPTEVLTFARRTLSLVQRGEIWRG